MVRNSGTVSQRTPWTRIVIAGLGLVLAGCVNTTPLEDLEFAKPTGTEFDTALYHDYAFLARSFGNIGPGVHSVFDYNGSTSLNETTQDIANLANTFAEKAVLAADGRFIDPVPSNNPESHEVRDKLLRALQTGRDYFPRDAALAQANYDCWQLNAPIESQKDATAHCRASLDKILSTLEKEVTEAEAARAAKIQAAKEAQEAARKKAMEEQQQQQQQQPAEN